MIVTLVGHELFLGLETGACQKKSLRNTELREQGDQNNANTPHHITEPPYPLTVGFKCCF